MMAKNMPIYIFIFTAVILANNEGASTPIKGTAFDDIRSTSESEPLILTKFIEEGKLNEARGAARVDPDQMLGINSYAGYFTVNKKHNGNLFFWYFPVENQTVEETPWIIWLQGGPGGSSMYGLFTEIGPFYYKHSKLEKREHSWGKNHSLVFIDNPVGTGFSFTDDSGYAREQTTIGKNLYNALQQFLTVFPELRKAPLTIAGESYAGKHIPSLGIQIYWHQQEDPAINLTHIAIGNGFIDPITLLRYSYFLREIGVLDDHEADCIKRHEEKTVQFIEDGNMTAAFLSRNETVHKFLKVSGVSYYHFLKEPAKNNGGEYETFLNRDEVQKAIHARSTNFTSINESILTYLRDDFMNSVKPWLEELIGNYKVLCYSGQLDIAVAYRLSVNTYRTLKFPGSENMNSTRRKKWYDSGRLAGYYKTVGNFTEIMVRGAGHMVPADQPSAALKMISDFVRNIELGVSPYNYLQDPVSIMAGNFVPFLNRDEVQQAIHVGNRPFTALNGIVYEYLAEDIMKSGRSWKS